MAYNDDLTWDDLAQLAQQRGRELSRSIREANAARDEWQSFRNGRDDSSLAAYFTTQGRTTSAGAVTDMRQNFTSYSDVFAFCDNSASPVVGDRFADWRKFT